jgi:DNA-directed RNA polymerase subunit RPC12/RpoP
MKCEHCGHEQASGNFCDACGRKLTRVIVDRDDDQNQKGESAPRRLKCRYCGHTQVEGRFCDGCGMMFDAYRVEDGEEPSGARCPQCARFSTTPICPNCGIPVPGFPTEEET